ncbi:ewing's tumor-associated antigen 1 [Solea solea]|uniref:ewing's tumor-associated antigen 1 n=1 Tax=Solea solea TaxID=90069 RepID=UPI002729EC29|nr:ewing's tumor-associated antigen 1 [Solea solea]
MPGTTTTPVCKDLHSPQRKGWSMYLGLNNGDSPGDAETSQDIIWDPTSPTPANAGAGMKNTRVVEISDIANRIAPKGIKPKATDSSLLQWIGDSAVPCTPEVSEPRVKRRSRQSSVEDLMKLAKQFDKNMQQDEEISEHLNTVNSNHKECVNTSKFKPTETSFRGDVKDLKCPSSSDQVEAELHALFDSSTQKVSGPLSQGSSVSACSQELKKLPTTTTLAEPQQLELKLAHKSRSAAQAAEGKGSCDDFDDDWENDDLLNDSFVLALTQNPDQQQDTNPTNTFQPNTKINAAHSTSVCKPSADTNSSHQRSDLRSNPSCSLIQKLCPKPKTTNRSTFKLESNPHFKLQTAAKEAPKSSCTVTRAKPQMSEQKSVSTKRLTTPQPDKIANDQRGACVAADSIKDISDGLWDEWDDDALLQVCDSVERISNSQPQQVSPSSCQAKEDTAVERQRKTTAPVPIGKAWSTKAGASSNQQSPRAFARSNSLPGTSSGTVNYQGWNIEMKGANKKSGMSQSLPGSRVSLGTFNQCRDSSGTVLAVNVDMKPHTVTTRATEKSHHTAFKRNVSDSAAISSKVFVTSQMAGKCSAAEIERKKQEALARRRLRMQNASKP